MIEPGKGWVRRVTTSTLRDIQALLRTGTERAAETRSGEEAESNGVPQDDPTISAEHLPDSKVADAEARFRGSPIIIPSQYRSHLQRTTVRRTGPPAGPRPTTRETSATAGTGIAPPTVTRRWFKRMSAADAQRPRAANTNPTGHLTPVKSDHPIQPATWFHDHLFAGAEWLPAPSPTGGRERATTTFHVRIGEEDLGELLLDVTYTPSFEAGQGNRTTVVHWGTTIGDRFRQHDYTGYYVTIERTTAGIFIMTIGNNPTGQFRD